ncbi:4-alpha-glucanotransferase [Canicola haemoglobinophilus]|uniref:4-alpha-glucanotransferase n=1 Tax=Canicola haemoglobinophilus TaxID=733 RepID=A0AB38H7W5_9PAST|nr:4-alpha-glucanotransferase [Canicola haemoglobinophilus]STO53916.1 4-alpha-glucanotransferase [Canicola haemoglobinophilus]STO68449.1 4-alpha-glucanotransferase [Canicola haemoglobinophilus]
MDISNQLQQEAEKVGIAISHYDIDGNLIYAKPENLHYFIQLLSQTKINPEDKQFDNVIVVRESEPISYDLAPLNLSSPIPIQYSLYDDNGNSLYQNQILGNQTALILSPLTYGYYSLHLDVNGSRHVVRILVAPKQSYQPPVFQGKKAWGINVQLYSLVSERNWGIGDFADLAYLIKQSAVQGADFVGINPLHQLYPSVPEWASPYSSSSRRWLNFLYLAVDQLPEFNLCQKVQNWFKQENIQQQLEQLRQAEIVDYQAVMALKRSTLEELFAYFKRSRASKILERRRQFAEFVSAQGDALLLQALFDVLDSIEHQQMPDDENKIGWLGWRKEWQVLTQKERQNLFRKYKTQVDFYVWLQWLANTQLAELKTLCLEKGMSLGIYGDLAVSSSRGSADVWSDQSLYCVNASVGAPPDPLGPVGQNWNIPPYNPTILKARGFQPFIDMLRANMQHFGVLRVDHIMGLFRLWLIPEGKNASDGLYVHYPFAELMAILAIESQRNQCLVVGEDLGTVPDEVRSKLDEFNVFSYFVLYFEQRNFNGMNEYPKAEHFPLQAFATVGTHDLPSLQSFWHCRDLELFAQLGILQEDFLKAKYDQRVVDKQALLNTLHRDQYLPPDYWGDALSMAMHDNLNLVIHQYLAESQTQLIGVQLENLLSQEVSFNLPGTSTEYPNWRKRLSQSLEHIFTNETVLSLVNTINQARNK